MNEGGKQAALSALRSILIAVGSVLTARGYVDDATVQAVVGALLVLIPVVWGIWDKYRTEQQTVAREVIAVNAGIQKADATVGKTPEASPAAAKAIIEIYKE